MSVKARARIMRMRHCRHRAAVTRLSPVNWDDLKIILALKRTGSQTAAAQLLRLNQSTIARRLNAIEADLGIILFSRSKAGFTPTEAGDLVLGTAEDIERSALGLRDAVDAFRRDLQGLVQIMANYWVLQHLIVPALSDFCAQHPDIELQLIGDPRGRKLSSQQAQLDIRFESGAEGGAIPIELCRIPYAVYGPAGADPKGLDWLTFWIDEFDYAPERWLRRNREQEEFLRVRANDASLVLGSITAGLGKGLVPEIIAEHEPLAERITGGGHEIVRPMYLLVHPDIIEMQRVKIVVAWLRDLFARLFPST